MNIIDLSALAAPNAVEPLDFETLFAERKAALIALYPADQQAAIAATLALESEPMTRHLQENAYRELILRARINSAAVANMLAWAEEADLDNLVANWDVERLTVQQGDDTATPPIPTIMESDDALRERALMAWDAMSTAGPRGAYEFWARSADGRIIDAKAISPSPAVAVVTIISSEGDGTASQELIAKATAECSDEDRLPVADRLTVQSAGIMHYTITAKLHMELTGAEAELALTAARAALAAWVNPRKRIGVRIARSGIDAVLHVPGVVWVELVGWADIIPTDTQAAYCTGYTVEVAP
ncbi:baseplate assembly protein [Aeromonas caviae]|uniref:baseplate J/gp47 family protein n=1 Tax=Aeromonas caviae TaxID=648 RepID=UPI001CC3B19A|nr:baseplate J/gp47 family protein [Aeromonas caviae]BDA11937.1 baseplate assembly protein [Aeromonas caviae]